ncbi:MAG: electron transport complex subunit RsxB [Pseudomonadota bacterium]|jgi:electron transport complex protein RnfB
MESLAQSVVLQWLFLGLLAGTVLLATAALVRTLLRSARHQSVDLINQVNALLPQTQCGQCGHPGCRPYARAIVNGAAINKCPPGGRSTIDALARLLNETPRELDPAHGSYQPPQVAVIREAECIGCTKCIQACPVDAILGAPKLMHTVIADECTGCALCIAPCPVDCIDLLPISRFERPAWPYPQRLASGVNSLAPGGTLLSPELPS